MRQVRRSLQLAFDYQAANRADGIGVRFHIGLLDETLVQRVDRRRVIGRVACVVEAHQ